MVRPVAESIPVSFGYLRPYSSGKPHKGVDFGSPKGTKVVAAIGGTVWYAGNGGGWGSAYGAQVIIKGTLNGATRYVLVAHLSRIDVRTGQSVAAGAQLGLTGGVPGQWGAGNTTGAHIHFQVNRSSTWYDHVDPWPAINYRPPTVFKPTVYYVTVPRLTAHASPSVSSRTLPSPLSYGGKLTIRGIKVVYGTTWGWTLRATGKAWWILEGRTSKTVPPPQPSPPQPVAEITVGSYNLAAQSDGHNETWRPKRAAMTVANMVDSAADVVLVQESGSSIYLDALDAELADADTDLVRVLGGSKWRHILRRTTRTKFVAAKTVTLKTGTDSDGSQVAMAVLEIAGVRASFASLHFDVGASDEVHRAQAEEAIAALVAFDTPFGVHPMNRTIGGDTNDRNGVVDRVMRTHGLVPMADDAPVHHQADKKTTNRWSNAWVAGPRIDNIYVPAGSSVSWKQQLDAEASDHNMQTGVRKLYSR